MHRTEAANNADNLYTDGPPGTRLGSAAFNSIQEELAYVIEQADLTLQTAASDDYSQLKLAIEILSLAHGGIEATAKVWFYQDSEPAGWTIDSTPADAILAVKGGAQAYSADGGTQAGTWTPITHSHGVSGGVTNYSGADSLGGGITSSGSGSAGGTIDGTVATLAGALATDAGAAITGTATGAASANGVTGTFANHVHTLDSSGSAASQSEGDKVYKNAGKLVLLSGGGADTLDIASDHTASDGSGNITATAAAHTHDEGDFAFPNHQHGLGTLDINTHAHAIGSLTTPNHTHTNNLTAPNHGHADSISVDAPSEAVTYRPLAQVGIICTKD